MVRSGREGLLRAVAGVGFALTWGTVAATPAYAAASETETVKREADLSAGSSKTVYRNKPVPADPSFLASFVAGERPHVALLLPPSQQTRVLNGGANHAADAVCRAIPISFATARRRLCDEAHPVLPMRIYYATAFQENSARDCNVTLEINLNRADDDMSVHTGNCTPSP
jgi:hypothetical protein